ncbi:MAG: VWA domain-containing protein [Pseudomonadota bacterium]
MPVTRFPARAEGPTERMVDFIAHLRSNGLAVGTGEAAVALSALPLVNAADPGEVRTALSAVLAKTPEERARFTSLFDAYWHNRGSERTGTTPHASTQGQRRSRPGLFDPAHQKPKGNKADTPDEGDDEGDAAGEGEGRLVASGRHNLAKVDLRELVQPADLKAAEATAERIARAIRDRRSRRLTKSRRGRIDLRTIARRSLQTGEPMDLAFRTRKERPARIVALVDVSGSMSVYARVFLAFVKGLMGADRTTEAFLFHTRLVRISDALRDGDTLRAVNRLSLLAEGFGGGTRIGANLTAFHQQHARRIVDGRTVVLILSDGYDKDPPELTANALQVLKRRNCRIVWLNPLKGWRGYAPVAKAMAAALPHIDHFASAATINDLAALEGEFSCL